MRLYILMVIFISIILSLYFLSGVFYVIQKPQFIINRKLNKINKKYSVTNIEDYLKSLGKSNICISILSSLGLIVAIYLDEINSNSLYPSMMLFAYAFFVSVLKSKFEKKIKKYLVVKDTETIDS